MNNLTDIKQDHPELGVILKSTPILKDQDTTDREGSSPNSDWQHMNLRERSQILGEALSFIGDNPESEEDLDVLNDIKSHFEEKLATTGYIAKRYDEAASIIKSEADCLKEQLKALEKRASVFTNRSKRIKSRMMEVMLENNLKKVETPLLSVAIRKLPLKVAELPEANIEQLLDTPYVRTKHEFNKKEILADLKIGKDVPGFNLSQPEFSLSIK